MVELPVWCDMGGTWGSLLRKCCTFLISLTLWWTFCATNPYWMRFSWTQHLKVKQLKKKSGPPIMLLWLTEFHSNMDENKGWMRTREFWPAPNARTLLSCLPHPDLTWFSSPLFHRQPQRSTHHSPEYSERLFSFRESDRGKLWGYWLFLQRWWHSASRIQSEEL